MKWYFIVCIAAKSTFLNFLKCPKMFHWISNKQYLTSLLKEIKANDQNSWSETLILMNM